MFWFHKKLAKVSEFIISQSIFYEGQFVCFIDRILFLVHLLPDII